LQRHSTPFRFQPMQTIIIYYQLIVKEKLTTIIRISIKIIYTIFFNLYQAIKSEGIIIIIQSVVQVKVSCLNFFQRGDICKIWKRIPAAFIIITNQSWLNWFHISGRHWNNFIYKGQGRVTYWLSIPETTCNNGSWWFKNNWAFYNIRFNIWNSPICCVPDFNIFLLSFNINSYQVNKNCIVCSNYRRVTDIKLSLHI